MGFSDIKIIAFDADDTLWDNEHYFREAEDAFTKLLSPYLPEHSIIRELFRIEMQNLETYGYGIKSFMLSMIETALDISDGKVDNKVIYEIINVGKEMLNKPVTILPGVKQVLSHLKGKYRLVMATKGDLRDQEKKLEKSGLSSFFHHTEVMSEKNEFGYGKLISHLDIKPASFLMVGNSIKSDILPVLRAGGKAIYVPYHITWEHEKADIAGDEPGFFQVRSISDIPALIEGNN